MIHEYAGLLKGGYEFPPLLVVFDGADYWLVDGFHRRWAAIRSKIDKFKCFVVQGTREDARWLSYGCNKDHGLPRSNEDKKKAVVAALKHPKGAKMSDAKIAEHVGVSHPFVGKIRKQLGATCNDFKSTDRTGRDGRTTNTTNIGKGKKKPKSSAPPKTNGKPKAVDQAVDAADDIGEWEGHFPYEVKPVAEKQTAKEPTPLDHLKYWWAKADATQQTLFRLFIDGEVT